MVSAKYDQFPDHAPMVTVVIPCYNQGAYLQATVDSVLKQTHSNIEIVVVNDGSDDEHTLSVFQILERQNVPVLHTANQGLAAARNNGINIARGEFILPLDADDLIGELYVEKAVAVFEKDPSIGIVYCKAKLFGAVETEWLLPPYSLEKMLFDNVIFCSALFRKADWEAVGGYDTAMVYGWEDYEFWLSLIELGRGVYQIPEIFFFYRVASDSMVRSKKRSEKVAMFKRIFERHQQLYADNIEIWINALLDINEKYYSSKLYVDTGEGISEQNCLSRKVDQGTAEIHFVVKDFKNIQSIRFDPVDAPAVVEIFEIRFVDNKGGAQIVAVSSDNAMGREGAKMYFASHDANCFFDVSEEQLQDLATITVKLSFLALEADALRQIVQWQQQQLEMVAAQKNIFPGGLKTMGKVIKRIAGKAHPEE